MVTPTLVGLSTQPEGQGQFRGVWPRGTPECQPPLATARRLLHRPTHLPALPHQDTHSPPGKSAKCGLRVLSQAPPCGDGCQDGICPGRKCMIVPPDPTVPLSNPSVNSWASLFQAPVGHTQEP